LFLGGKETTAWAKKGAEQVDSLQAEEDGDRSVSIGQGLGNLSSREPERVILSLGVPCFVGLGWGRGKPNVKLRGWLRLRA